MVTNYYCIENVCCSCGRGSKRRHIGKSSSGWCFGLHVYPEDGIYDLPNWIEVLSRPGSRIEDEYGAKLTWDEMFHVIHDRSREKPVDESQLSIGDLKLYQSVSDFYEKNHAVPGPNNLVRHRCDGFCFAWGDGPWDLMVGEFS